jgi:chromate reductase
VTSPIHVLGISGSLRKGSLNTALLRAAGEMLPEGMTLEIYDLSGIPFYNGDVEDAGFPEPVVHFKSRIAAADALLIACPEYNYSLTGVLKNAIDWASRPIKGTPFYGKPAAIMGAGGRYGSTRAQMHLRQIAVYVNLLPLSQPQLAIIGAAEKFDANLKLTDEPTRQALRALLEALAAWTRRLSGVPR